MSGAQPGDVFGDGLLGAVAGLEAGVVAEPADVEGDGPAGRGRATAVEQLQPRVGTTARIASAISRLVSTHPAAMLLVGDNLQCDVTGPLAHGMCAALVRPDGLRPAEAFPEGTLLIQHVRELPALLEATRGQPPPSP